MSHLEMDWTDSTKTAVAVTRATINGLKVRKFDNRADAEAFANKAMGARGSVLSCLDMSDEQRAAMEARKARLAAIFEELESAQ